LTMLIQFPGSKAGSYTIPNSVTHIGDSAFGRCASLISVTIPDSLTDIAITPFGGCTSLTAINVDVLNPNYSSLDGVMFDKGQTTLIQCPEGKTGSYTIPNSVAHIGDSAFESCVSLTNVTIPNSVTEIGSLAFGSCTSLTAAYFEGNAPTFCCGPINPPAFEGATNATVFYLPGTTGWSASEDRAGCPTAPWLLPCPVILTTAPNFGIQNNAFGFRVSWATNASVVVEASTTLANPTWTSFSTNTLIKGWSYFSDAEWTNYPVRFYRVRSL
jgi:hypothetical protein